MFFGLFKRAPASTAKPKHPTKSAGKERPPFKPSRTSWRATLPDLPPELRSPEVIEGNDSTDWALWQDSVNSFDSQLQSMHPSVKLYRHEPETTTEFQEIDAYARVRPKDR